ncbi:MAG: hypothetical protein ACK4ND_04300, partial [Cytophagaceae bacterium]
MRKFFFPALGLKLMSGVLMGIVYTYYYSGGDTFSIYEEGLRLNEIFRNDIASYFKILFSGNTTDESLIFR